jgi:hypothetical protein
LSSANAALIALRAALAAEPGNPGLTRALEETERAIRLLEQKRDRLNSVSASTSRDR